MTHFSFPDIIHTERLQLRPHRFDDLDDILVFSTDVRWAQYLPVPHPYTREDGELFLTRQVSADTRVMKSWAIVFNGQVIGGINVRSKFEAKLIEMGYSVSPFHWGKGLATEAARGVIQTSFEHNPTLNRVRAMADRRNIASQKVLTKLGFTQEGILRQNRVTKGEFVDEVWFGLLRAEWKASGYQAP